MYERTADDAISLEFDKAVVVDDEADDNNWWTFKPLAYLDLSSNVLRNIPSEIGMFEDLTVLNVGLLLELLLNMIYDIIPDTAT